MTVRRLCNLVYTLQVEGLDPAQIERFDVWLLIGDEVEVG